MVSTPYFFVAAVVLTSLATDAHEFEISPEIFLAGSPSAMLVAFLETQGDMKATREALNRIPSACKSEGLVEFDPQRSGVERGDCNLTNVDPECFLVNLSGQVAKAWGTERQDEERTRTFIKENLTKGAEILQAAAVVCTVAPVVVPLLHQFGGEVGPANLLIEAAKEACQIKN